MQTLVGARWARGAILSIASATLLAASPSVAEARCVVDVQQCLREADGRLLEVGSCLARYWFCELDPGGDAEA